jgi:regulator of sigma D
MTVGIRLMKIFNHRRVYGFRHAKAESPRISNVQLDDFMSGLFQFLSAPSQRSANFVADVIEMRARRETRQWHKVFPEGWEA